MCTPCSNTREIFANHATSVRFEVLTAIDMKIYYLLGRDECSLVDYYLRFGTLYWFHFRTTSELYFLEIVNIFISWVILRHCKYL
jgi:hypothetical protein